MSSLAIMRAENICSVDFRNKSTVRVAYYEPAYYEHSFIMNQTVGPNKNNPIAFVLNKVRLI